MDIKFMEKIQELVKTNPGQSRRDMCGEVEVEKKTCRTKGITHKRPIVRQQDRAACHTFRMPERLIPDPFFELTSPDMWTPNSLDLNLMDF